MERGPIPCEPVLLLSPNSLLLTPSVSCYGRETRMSLFSPPERSFARALSELIHCNPFLPERVRYEGDALGSEERCPSGLRCSTGNAVWGNPPRVRIPPSPPARSLRLDRRAPGAHPASRNLPRFVGLSCPERRFLRQPRQARKGATVTKVRVLGAFTFSP